MVERSELAESARPESMIAALRANAEELRGAAAPHHGGDLTSVRRSSHNGHEIVVRTTYAISVDGRDFDVHLTVDNGGRVHYHGLPTRDFASVIDLVEKAIDTFPDDFGAAGPDAGDDGRHHAHGGHH